MLFISVTRLRIRSVRFLPLFALHTFRSVRQVKAASGFQGGSLLNDRQWTFWTLTTWQSEASMRAFMTSGAHRVAMPRLLDWCDEASVVHWEQPEDMPPSWTDADRRMREAGRASKVRHPSPQHATMDFRKPRVTRAGPIRPMRAAKGDSSKI